MIHRTGELDNLCGPDGEWKLASNCHPAAPMVPFYRAKTKTMLLLCANCGKGVLEIAVEESPAIEMKESGKTNGKMNDADGADVVKTAAAGIRAIQDLSERGRKNRSRKK